MQIDFIGYFNTLKHKLTTEEAIHYTNSTSNILKIIRTVLLLLNIE